MEREQHVSAIADGKLPAHVDAGGFERAHLVQQRRRIDHHAIADDRLHSRPQYAARNQLENELLLANKDRVPGVVTTLVARNDIEILGEEVDNLALPLVAPLGAQHNDVSHVASKEPFYRAARVSEIVAEPRRLRSGGIQCGGATPLPDGHGSVTAIRRRNSAVSLRWQRRQTVRIFERSHSPPPSTTGTM